MKVEKIKTNDDVDLDFDTYKKEAEKSSGYKLTWRCNKDCKIDKEIFERLFKEEVNDFAKKFPFFFDTHIRGKITLNIFYRDEEPVKTLLFAISYGSRPLIPNSEGVIKFFKKSICEFHEHTITNEMKGQIFNLIIHESLHGIFGGDEETVGKITKTIGKTEKWIDDYGNIVDKKGKIIKKIDLTKIDLSKFKK